MPKHLPPLSSLRLFEAAARLLSFKKAAEELSVTPSAVSHGVQTLESWAGQALFERIPRGLRLTDAGALYYPIVQESLGLLAQGSEMISAQKSRQRLAISAAPTFANRWLLPRLPDFRERNPEVSIILDTAQAQVDLRSSAVDIAIRMGDGSWPGMFADLITRETLVPVCSPELFEKIKSGIPIQELPRISITQVSEDWEVWERHVDAPKSATHQDWRLDSIQLALEAAVQGLGVVMGRRPLIDSDLATGRLVLASTDEVPTQTGYWLVGPEDRASESHIAAFRSWLQAVAQETFSKARHQPTYE